MSDELGYKPSTAGPGKDGYNKYNVEHSGNTKQGNKKKQSGESEDSNMQAGDCLSQNNGVNNSDPEKDCTMGG